MQRSAARKTLVDAVEQHATHQATGWIPGSRYRNLHVAVLLERLVTRRFAFPAFVLAYRYADKPYRAIVHGQSAACVVGEAPYSWARIALAVVGAVALLAVITAIVIAFQS